MVGPLVVGGSDGIVYAKCRFVACSGKSYELKINEEILNETIY